MAKAKGKKGSGGGAQSHVRSRISYLHRAAAYLQSTQTGVVNSDENAENHVEETSKSHKDDPSEATITGSAIVDENVIMKGMSSTTQSDAKASSLRLPRHYISDMRGVSLKTQLRLPIEVKRSVCKRCDILLALNVTCIEEIQNASRGRKKPWADVRVVRCSYCGTEKRFPQTQKRGKKLCKNQQKKQERKDQSAVP